MTEIKYPIFLQDKDKYMYVINAHSDLNGELEQIDIDNKEYSGWDIEGKPLDFYMEKKEIKVKIIFDNLKIEKLRKNILNYAKIARPKTSFICSENNNIIDLFTAVEKHIKEGSVKQKLKKFLKK